MKNIMLISLLLVASILPAAEAWVDYFPIPQSEFNPRRYICYQTDKPLIIDGKIEEEIWQQAEWTNSFIDIEGEHKPAPFHDTKVKMLWDENYFYFAAILQEPHIWAKLKERDSVIFFDNDFEIFIDPDGDTHNYFEFEMNAFNTVWDLLLTAPYRDAECKAIDSWDIQGLQSAVYIDGTLNNPRDSDNFWSLEVAIPWQVLEEGAARRPETGDQWRVNFSRVQWETEVVDNDYQKLDKPEYNWVWSPQGIINMHYPEMWGFVQFSDQIAGQATIDFKWDKNEAAKWYLRQIYYQQRDYQLKNGKFAEKLADLDLAEFAQEGFGKAKLYTSPRGFSAIIKSWDKKTEITIDQTGRTRIFVEEE
jgi:hypothetical protein